MVGINAPGRPGPGTGAGSMHKSRHRQGRCPGAASDTRKDDDMTNRDRCLLARAATLQIYKTLELALEGPFICYADNAIDLLEAVAKLLRDAKDDKKGR